MCVVVQQDGLHIGAPGREIIKLKKMGFSI
jgi:hypothetical protein